RGIELFEEAARRAISGPVTTVEVLTAHGVSLASSEPALMISGADAFKLHDTYGFPIDLTRIMAEERGMSVDLKGYEELMEKARELARSGGKEGSDTRLTDLPPDAIGRLQGEKI